MIMGVSYEKCDMCKECIPDCGDNDPMEVEGTNKHVCPDCFNGWLDRNNPEFVDIEDCEICGDDHGSWYDCDWCMIKKEYNPFKKEQPTNEMNDLLNHMLNERMKDLCDKIKVQVLDSLIKLSEEKNNDLPVLTKYDLLLIRDGINELRNKEKEKELKVLASVIDDLVSRGNDEL